MFLQVLKSTFLFFTRMSHLTLSAVPALHGRLLFLGILGAVLTVVAVTPAAGAGTDSDNDNDNNSGGGLQHKDHLGCSSDS